MTIGNSLLSNFFNFIIIAKCVNGRKLSLKIFLTSLRNLILDK